MKINKEKELKELHGKGLSRFSLKRVYDKTVKKSSGFSKTLIALSTLVIIPILSSMPSEIVISNNVVQQDIQVINIKYEIER